MHAIKKGDIVLSEIDGAPYLFRQFEDERWYRKPV